MTTTEYLSRESQPVLVSKRRPPSLDSALSLSWIFVAGRVHEGNLKSFISVLSRTTSSVASIFDRSVCRTLSGSTAEETLGEFNSATQTTSEAEPFWPVTELFCPSTTCNLPTRRDEEATQSRSIIVEIPPASYAVASRRYRGLCRAAVVINWLGRTPFVMGLGPNKGVKLLIGLGFEAHLKYLLFEFSSFSGPKVSIHLSCTKPADPLWYSISYSLLDCHRLIREGFGLDHHVRVFLTDPIILYTTLSSLLDWIDLLIREKTGVIHLSSVRLLSIIFSKLSRYFGNGDHSFFPVRIFSVLRLLHYASCQAFAFQTMTMRALTGLLETVLFWSPLGRCEATLVKHLDPIVEDVVFGDYHRSSMFSEDLFFPALLSVLFTPVDLHFSFEDLEEFISPGCNET